MRILFLNILFFFILISLHSQTIDKYNISYEISFANHLINIGDIDEANYVLYKLNSKKYLSQSTVDSINYLHGICFKLKNEPDSSSKYFLLVSKTSNKYIESRFNSSYNSIIKGNFDDSKKILIEVDTLKQLKNLELSGICLLERNLNDFKILSSGFNYNYSPIAQQEHNLNDYYLKISKHKNKSMFVAGLLSAVVPGAGKIYAGKNWEGLSSLFMVGCLGATTYECYRKAGVSNYKTIIFGSIFTIFYIGNIWGSSFSVKIKNDEFSKTINQQILLDLNIPLHTIFN